MHAFMSAHAAVHDKAAKLITLYIYFTSVLVPSEAPRSNSPQNGKMLNYGERAGNVLTRTHGACHVQALLQTSLLPFCDLAIHTITFYLVILVL